MVAAKSSDLSFRPKPIRLAALAQDKLRECEEWSERDERHGRLCREGSGERVGRRTSSIYYCPPLWCSTLRDVSTPLGMTKDDIAQGRKCSLIISDCERRANFHGALRSFDFLGRLRLFRKMHRRFVAIVRDEIRRFFETKTTQRAAGIHIPLPGRVLRLLDQFVRHDSSKLRITSKKVRMCPLKQR